MRFGAFIITFNRPKILSQTIELILEQTRPPDLILVVDNANSQVTEHIASGFSPEKVTYTAMSDNLGPAGAAAYALNWLNEQSYDWIYWGDDDNPPKTLDTLDRLLKIAVCASEDVSGVGAVGSVWDWEKGEMNRLPDKALHGAVNVDTIAGNSQLILRSQVIQAVGLPDPRLFFGLEEPEYCLRITNAGYRLLVDGDLMREYRAMAGRLNFKRRRSLRPRYLYHTIWRQYYSTRNYIFAMNQTFQRPNLARREALKALGRTFFAWGRGPRYGATFTKFQLRGVLDGYLGRMGRTVVPQPKPSIPMKTKVLS